MSRTVHSRRRIAAVTDARSPDRAPRQQPEETTTDRPSPCRFPFARTSASFRSHKPSSGPRVHASMITKLLDRKPDDILAELLNSNFPLDELLNDRRMATSSDWIVNMTTVLEQVTKCQGSRERVAMILSKIPTTNYVKGVHEEVIKRDPITDELPYGFIKSFLNMANEFVSMIPHSANDLITIFERIELNFSKVKTKPPVSCIKSTTSLLFDDLDSHVGIRRSKRHPYGDQ